MSRHEGNRLQVLKYPVYPVFEPLNRVMFELQEKQTSQNKNDRDEESMICTCKTGEFSLMFLLVGRKSENIAIEEVSGEQEAMILKLCKREETKPRRRSVVAISPLKRVLAFHVEVSLHIMTS